MSDDRSPGGARAGLGLSFSHLEPAKPADAPDDGAAEALKGALSQPERPPDIWDVAFQHGDTLERASGIVTPPRVRERQERIRLEGRLHAQGMEQHYAEAQAGADEHGVTPAERAAMEAWLDEDADE